MLPIPIDFIPQLTRNLLDAVAEAAVVGINDELTGQAVNAFVALKDGHESNDQIRKDLILQVRKSIGPFAAPKAVFIVDDLPKTRSGKIMRRILRKILSGEEDSLGDISTVSDIFTSSLLDSGNGNTNVCLRDSSCRTPASWKRSSTLCTSLRRSRERSSQDLFLWLVTIRGCLGG
jgi:AMP-binding enzyme C-terminal domain